MRAEEALARFKEEGTTFHGLITEWPEHTHAEP